jgi:hypothetical protein
LLQLRQNAITFRFKNTTGLQFNAVDRHAPRSHHDAGVAHENMYLKRIELRFAAASASWGMTRTGMSEAIILSAKARTYGTM